MVWCDAMCRAKVPRWCGVVLWCVMSCAVPLGCAEVPRCGVVCGVVWCVVCGVSVLCCAVLLWCDEMCRAEVSRCGCGVSVLCCAVLCCAALR